MLLELLETKQKNILETFKVYRMGPLVAFSKGAHSVSQSLFSYYFAKYGIESYLYIRKNSPSKGKRAEELFSFLGVKTSEKLRIRLTSHNKGLSSIENFLLFLMDISKNRKYNNFLFLSKPSHVIQLSKFKKVFNFKIIYENHTNNPNIKASQLADITYTVSPDVYDKIKVLNKKAILWTYHYPIQDKFFLKKGFQEKNIYTLGYIGSLLREKGIDTLFESIRNINNIKLKIIGGNDKQINSAKKLTDKLNISNKVEFAGFVSQSELPKELKDIDILIAPFKKSQKTIPLKIYEYLATGIPTIASDIDSVKVIAKNFVFYFEAENSNSLQETIKRVISNPKKAKEISEKSCKYVENFKWEKVIEKMIMDLEKII